jgi:hypothetical protein
VDLSTALIELLQRPYVDADQTGWVIARQQQAFSELLASGRFVVAAQIVESLRNVATSADNTEQVREVAIRCLDGLREADTLGAIVDILGEVKSAAIPSVHRLIELLGPQAIHELLLVLGEESNLARRRQIFDLLVSLGSAVVPAALALLDDSRWYMTRNILGLLRRVGEGISLERVGKGLRHDDPRVRAEAVKCLPALANQISPELAEELIGDPDARVAELAVKTFGSSRIRAAGAPMAELLRRADPLGRQKNLRLVALQALGEIGDPAILPMISHYFRSWFGLVSIEERHAAFESLRLYPESARRQWVKKGLFAPDKKVREICKKLQGSHGESENGS